MTKDLKAELIFIAKEDPDLEGLLKVTLLTEKPLSMGGYIALRYRGDECAALIDSIKPGRNLILMDPYLRLRLGCREGSEIEIRSVELQTAKKVEAFIPADLIEDETAISWIKEKLVDKPVTEGLEIQVPILSLEDNVPVLISKVIPSPFAIFTRDTKIDFEELGKTKEEIIGIRWSDIGGIDPAKEKVRELVEYPMRFPEVVKYLGLEPPKGILLYGPPGTGKTLIAKALANELKASFFQIIQGPEIMSSLYGESERRLREIFEKASKNATSEKPSIIVIDEVDSIAPKRGASGGGAQESRLVATLLTLMDGLKETKGVIVIGTTNRPNALDPALRRPGRFEYEIYVGLPNTEGRKEILKIHTRRMPLEDKAEDLIEDIANRTHGFSGADLAFLCKEAGRNAFRRLFLRGDLKVLEEIENEFKKNRKKRISFAYVVEKLSETVGEVGTDISPGGLKESKSPLRNIPVEVTRADFEEALVSVSPSGMREVMVQIPSDVTWDKIGGLKEVKKIIEQNVIKAIQKPEVFKQMGIKPARGILLYGPPGTGKTLIAKAIANECGANFIAVKGPELRSKWFGESEEKIRFIFETARRHAPCIIFLDEVDSLMPARGKDISGITDSIVNQFLSEMDGVEEAEGIFVIGATNRPELIDEALLRPGRFNYQIYVPLPDEEARKEIFKIHLKKKAIAEDVKIEELVKKTKGFSGAEIAEICRLAGLKALEEVNFNKFNPIRASHIFSAIEEIREENVPKKTGKVIPFPRIGKVETEFEKAEEASQIHRMENKLPETQPKKSILKKLLYPILCLCIIIGVLTSVYFYFPKNFIYYWLTPGITILALDIGWLVQKYLKIKKEGI